MEQEWCHFCEEWGHGPEDCPEWVARSELEEAQTEFRETKKALDAMTQKWVEAMAQVERLWEVVEQVEWCVDTSSETGNDTRACPVCHASKIYGMDGEHKPDCLFAAEEE